MMNKKAILNQAAIVRAANRKAKRQDKKLAAMMNFKKMTDEELEQANGILNFVSLSRLLWAREMYNREHSGSTSS